MLPFAALLLAAQVDTVLLKDAPCAACSIRVEPVARLGERRGGGIVTSSRVAVAQDARGRYLVATTPTNLAVFSPQGTFVRSVGRSGGGPGEYRRIWRIASSASAIYVYDDQARRRTQLSLDFDVVATQPMQEVPWSVRVRPDGSGVMAAIVPTREHVGYLLHDFDVRGQRTRSYGMAGVPYREDIAPLFRRTLSPGLDPREFWSSHFREYVFERCRHGASGCSLFVRNAAWFPPRAFDSWPEGNAPPPSMLQGVTEDSAGFVWTLSWVADSRWAAAIRLATADEYAIDDIDRYFDTVIERVDTRTGRVLASRRLDAQFMGFVAPGVVWRYAEDDDGFGRIEIERLRVVTTANPQRRR